MPKLDLLLDGFIANGLVGCSLLVFKGNSEKYYYQTGLKDIENKELKIIIRVEKLGVKSLLRKHFEKTVDLVIVPCYEESAFEKKKINKRFF